MYVKNMYVHIRNYIHVHATQGTSKEIFLIII